MGKYAPSKLRMRYSDWHFKKCSRKSYALDIDMLEVRKVDGILKPVAITEICRFGDNLTRTQQSAYPWLKQKTELPVYIIECNDGFDKFRVHELNEKEKHYYNEREFIDFINNIEVSVPSYQRYDRNVDYSRINKAVNEYMKTKIPNHTQVGLDYKFDVIICINNKRYSLSDLNPIIEIVYQINKDN